MNEKNIQTIAMEEIWKKSSDGHLPVLLEIFNPDLKWNDGSLEQENMYLRVIDDSNPVIHKGKKYLPSCFEFTPPEEDGKTVGLASITLSAIDSRVVQMLRSIELQCDVKVMAAFMKIMKENGGATYKFCPIEKLFARMLSASYNRTTAQLTLSFKDVLKLNVPRNVATKNRLPSVSSNA